MSQSQKILRIFFKNLGLFVSRSLVWWLVCRWKVYLQMVHRDFYSSHRDSLASRLSSHEKHLENTSDFLFLSVLAASPSDLHTTWFSSENHVFCVLRAVFKTFQFSLEHFWLFIVFPVYPSLKITVSLLKNLHFCIISSSNLQGKGMGFLFLTSYFMIMVLFSWFVSYFCDLSNIVFVHGFG